MYKFMIATFLLLGWGFYQASGGSDFEPEQVAFSDVKDDVTPEVTPIVVPEVLADVATNDPAVEVTPQVEEPVIASLTLEAETNEPEVQTLASLSEVLENAEEPAVEVSTAMTFEPVQVNTGPELADIRAVAGSRVNMRSGPGTDYGVLSTLSRGTEAEVLEVDSTGWARIRIIGSGQIGWMAERLLETL